MCILCVYIYIEGFLLVVTLGGTLFRIPLALQGLDVDFGKSAHIENT